MVTAATQREHITGQNTRMVVGTCRYVCMRCPRPNVCSVILTSSERTIPEKFTRHSLSLSSKPIYPAAVNNYTAVSWPAEFERMKNLRMWRNGRASLRIVFGVNDIAGVWIDCNIINILTPITRCTEVVFNGSPVPVVDIRGLYRVDIS
jgi:hypothetical protein